MKIVFMGSPDFAIPSLEKMYASEHEVVTVVSNVDKRRGRGGGTSPTPVKAKALELDLPVLGVEDLSSDNFADQLTQLEADLFVVVAFRILPKHILEIPKIGSVNLHASLLPKYRGAAPIHWAVMNGEEETGCSIFFLDEQVDTGAIIRQKSAPIGENETTGEVYNRLKVMGSEVLLEAVNEIASGDYETQKQDQNEATPAPKLFTEDCKIDFDQTAQEVHNKIRGLSPFPTAWVTLDGLKLNIYRSKTGPAKNLKAGEILFHDDDMIVGCGDGTVILEEVQLQGKKRMKASDFMHGYNGAGIIK